MPENTFDIVSKIDLNEVLNAVQQTSKEVQTRYDLKDSKSSIELNEKESKVLLQAPMNTSSKRSRDSRAETGKAECSVEGSRVWATDHRIRREVKQEINLQQGIGTEKAKEIVKAIKDSKLKVQATIQGDLVRVSAKDRDMLQQVISLLRGKDFNMDMQFTNYRSN